MSKRVKQLIILSVSIVFIGVFLLIVVALIPERESPRSTIIPDCEEEPDAEECQEHEIEVIPYDDLEVVRVEHARRDASSVDLVAEIRNPNPEWGVRDFEYTFALSNLLGVEQESFSGMSYILPGEVKYIVETSVPVNYQIGDIRVDIEEEHWRTIEDFIRLDLDIDNIRFMKMENMAGEPYELSAFILNNSVFALTDIRVIGLLFNENNDIIGANRTSIQRVLEGETRQVTMFWRDGEVVEDDVVDYEVIAYSNILKNDNFIRRYKVTDGGVGIESPDDPGSYFQLPDVLRRVRSWWR
ncbi:MAG: hypothetical protein WDZ39_01760 [Candidatus Spechtbacterales bacterium]